MTGFLWGDEADEFFSGARPREGGRPGDTEESPLSVSELTAWIKKALEGAIPRFWVVGEVGSVTFSNAGHVYLTIKDSESQVSGVLWRSTWEKCRFDLREGMSVLGLGKLDVYGPRGSYQVVLQRLEPQGLGPLQIAFRKLYARLEGEGLFRAERKRPLPRFPRRIGFVTSPQGAAIHDFLEVLRRRWPHTDVLVIPAKVQGVGAAEEIAQGIGLANRIRPLLDALVVGRGGGSIEDLWAFNEEVVVRAVVGSRIPVVSAVGHEIDVTLCDLAADVRALTPSEAAERLVPNREEVLGGLREVRLRLMRSVGNRVREWEGRLEGLESRPVIAQAERMMDTKVQRVDEMEYRVHETFARLFEATHHRFEKLSQRVEGVSPLKTLGRGYTLTSDVQSGRLVSSVRDVRPGQRLRTRGVDGQWESMVERVELDG
jgi:exodeoxyribonuclease VII large subunit